MNLKVRYWNVGLCLFISLTYFFGSERNVVKKSKSKNKNELTNNEKLVKMFEDQIPEDRQQVLRDIDSIMCNMLEVEPNDLPWINPNKHEEKWEILMNKLRLVVGRIEYASKQKTRTVH